MDMAVSIDEETKKESANLNKCNKIIKKSHFDVGANNNCDENFVQHDDVGYPFISAKDCGSRKRHATGMGHLSNHHEDAEMGEIKDLTLNTAIQGLPARKRKLNQPATMVELNDSGFAEANVSKSKHRSSGYARYSERRGIAQNLRISCHSKQTMAFGV